MDMDRVGLFSEMGYITIGDKYKNPVSGKNILLLLLLNDVCSLGA